MKIYTLLREQLVHRRLDETFHFFADPHNLEAITHTWLKFEIVNTPERLQAGSKIIYRLKWHGIPMRWKTDIQVWTPPFFLLMFRRAVLMHCGGTRIGLLRRVKTPWFRITSTMRFPSALSAHWRTPWPFAAMS